MAGSKCRAKAKGRVKSEAFRNAAEPRNRRVGARGRVRGQAVEGQARAGGHVAEHLELPSRLVEPAAEALEVLLEKLGRLREDHRAHKAKQAVQQSLAGGKEAAKGKVPGIDLHGIRGPGMINDRLPTINDQ